MLPTTENITTEFKPTFNEDVIESLVAFANAKGGNVYVGVTDSGKVKGVTVGKETIQNWINEVKNKTAPQLIPDAELLEIETKTVVKFFVPEYPIKPVSTRGRYYKRIANSNHLMGIDEIANEHLKTLNTSWDYYTDPNHSLNDISDEKVSKLIQKINQQSQNEITLSNSDFLRKMEIVRDEKITFGGYLMFAKDYCSLSDVQVGRFKSDITIIDSISLNFDLFQEVEDIIAFIKKHLMVAYIITGEPQRTERFDYPLDAIREIVVNMIVHRDYRESSASIIKIFDDRIEFYNPGKLYGGITIDDLLTGNYTSKSRNKLIAKIFKEAGLIERYGSGIMRVRKICKDYGIIEPQFSEISNGFMVTLYKEKFIHNIDYFVKESTLEIENVSGGQTGGQTGGQAGGQTGLTASQLAVFKVINQNNKVSRNDIANILNISPSAVQKHILKLKQKNIIARVGGDFGGYWKVLTRPPID